MITSNGSNGKGNNIKLEPLHNQGLKQKDMEADGSGVKPLPPRTPSLSSFEAPVILTQSSSWSHWILWLLMAVTTGAVIWACLAKIEEAIPATGKLEPTGTVKEVQSPVSGVVKAIYVDDGQKVHKGDRKTPICSLKPRQVIQEIYGWLLAHWAVRCLMFQAAEQAGIAPLRLGNTCTLNVIQRAIPQFQQSQPTEIPFFELG